MNTLPCPHQGRAPAICPSGYGPRLIKTGKRQIRFFAVYLGVGSWALNAFPAFPAACRRRPLGPRPVWTAIHASNRAASLAEETDSCPEDLRIDIRPCFQMRGPHENPD